MEYSKIVSVTGLPGLFELINTKSDGAIVRSLDDKTTRFASSRIHNFSHLETIEVYTVSDNVNLAEVFQAMEKSSGSLPDTKDNDAIRKYFEHVYGDIDFERVYNSDLKKMIKWFEVLKKNNVDIKLSEPEPEEEEGEETPEPVTVVDKKESSATTEKKPAKKTSKTSSDKKEGGAEKKSTSSKTAKPAKKSAKKKGK
ncbi:MAG TPA: DUF5606 domain-containing protein [Chitinophagaceae bacterium]|jgi:uncharacterized protein DUF6852/uncharacterized protein DUF5606|nr:DUF5606 domain-containing protein [Chitinophagaceae bacterium]